MLILNKSLPESEIIVTLSEWVTIENPIYILKLHSYSTNKAYTISMGENVSTHKERYDLFYIEKEKFELVEEGIYLYNIYESSDLQNSIEIGYLKVKSNDDSSELITPIDSEADDDIIVYDN